MITAYFDGACTLNPIGHCACGVLISDDNEVLLEQGYYLGKCGGSNTAEYEGLIRILEFLISSEHLRRTNVKYNKAQIEIYGDSKLVIQQMTGKWKIKKGLYKESALKAQTLTENFRDITFKWIPRDDNEVCDELAEDAILTWQNENATF